MKRHIAGVHHGEKSKPKHLPVLKVEEASYTNATDTVLFTTTTDEMGETVLIKEVDHLTDAEFASSSFVIQKGSKDPGASAFPDGTALIVPQEALVEVQGQEEGFVLVTTDEGQKVLPLSQISQIINQQQD